MDEVVKKVDEMIEKDDESFNSLEKKIDDIKEMITNVTIKPKKVGKSKKLADDFDWSVIDEYIQSYFNNETQSDEQVDQIISLDSFFEAFKQMNEDYKIPDMKYQFKKRCNQICDVGLVVFGIKKSKK